MIGNLRLSEKAKDGKKVTKPPDHNFANSDAKRLQWWTVRAARLLRWMG